MTIQECWCANDLLLRQPAVMDLNMRVASAAMVLSQELLPPLLLDPFPVTLP